MLALLSAPRGRVSAARVAARAREREQAEVRRMVNRLPVERTAAVTPEYADEGRYQDHRDALPPITSQPAS